MNNITITNKLKETIEECNEKAREGLDWNSKFLYNMGIEDLVTKYGNLKQEEILDMKFSEIIKLMYTLQTNISDFLDIRVLNLFVLFLDKEDNNLNSKYSKLVSDFVYTKFKLDEPVEKIGEMLNGLDLPEEVVTVKTFFIPLLFDLATWEPEENYKNITTWIREEDKFVFSE